MNSNVNEVTVVFPHDTKINSIKDITVKGVKYVPFTGNRITPELAERRNQNAAMWGTCNWPGYFVTFRPAHCLSVKTLGRMGE